MLKNERIPYTNYSNFNLREFLHKILNTEAKEEIRLMIEEIVNEILEQERTEFLGYTAYSKEGYNSGDSRNGYYYRIRTSEFGNLNIKYPRVRRGDFESLLVPKDYNKKDAINNIIKVLLSCDLTLSDIAQSLDKIYDLKYSPQFISNVSKDVLCKVEDFHNKAVSSHYYAIFMDATRFPLRRGTVENEPIHILYGLKMDGTKEVIDYRIYPTESSEHYKEMLLNLKERGLEKVDLFVSDGLPGIKNAIQEVFPNSKHQRCWRHIMSNIYTKVRTKDRAEVQADAKLIYKANNKEEAEDNFEKFIAKYIKVYKHVCNELLTNKESLFSFYDFPESMRKSLYTTNWIEGLNKLLKYAFKKHQQFPNEESLERRLYTFFTERNLKCNKARNFDIL